MIMTPTPNQLKSVNPLLVWNSDDEINKAVFYLEKQGFFWSESRKVFYNERLGVTVSTQDIKKIINDNDFLDEKIEGAEKEDKKEEYLGNIKIAGKLINFFVFLIIVNLFLGWLFLHPFFWVFLEILFVFCLISFLKIGRKMRLKLSREIYNSKISPLSNNGDK